MFFKEKIKFQRNKNYKTLKFETAVQVLKHVPYMNRVHNKYFSKFILLL